MALKRHLTRQYLKETIGDENIFNFYFGDFNLCRSYNSIFRKDDKPSTGFYLSENGSIIYNDFTNGDKYDFVKFVMRLYNLTYYKALERIAIDFNLQQGERSSIKPAVIKHIKKPKKTEKVLQVGVCKFKKPHLEYWEKYNITEKELKENSVYAVNSLYLNGIQLPSKPNEIRFAYLIKDQNEKDYLKIYSPFNEEYKWVSSAPLNVPFGLNELSHKSDTLIITKGQKDRIVLKKFFTDVIATQNESKDALKKEVIYALKQCYKHIYIWFDMDKPGIRAANYYKRKYDFKPLFVGSSKRTLWQNIINAKKIHVKDVSDFVAYYGIENFKIYLQNLKLC